MDYSSPTTASQDRNTNYTRENHLDQPPYKRERLQPLQQASYNMESQGTSFGLNFVTYPEYQALKIEHDSLKAELSTMRESVVSDVQKALLSEMQAVKRENQQLKEEIRELKRTLSEGKSGGGGMHSKVCENGSAMTNGSGDGDGMADQLKHLTSELALVKASLSTQPPVPGSETVSYMKALISYYDQRIATKPSSSVPTTPTTTSDSSFPDLSHQATTLSSLSTLNSITTLNKLDLSHLTNGQHTSASSSTTALPLIPLPETSGIPAQNLDDLANCWNPTAVSSSFGSNPTTSPSLQKATAADPYMRPVQLVPSRDVWVDGRQLNAILRLTETRGGEDIAQFLLRRVVMLVFSVEELAYSRGQGIMSSTSFDSPHRRPLDPEKVAACKEFMRKWCYERNLEEPCEKAVNTVITHQITYSRTKLKRLANKQRDAELPNSAANATLQTFDVNQYFPRDVTEDVDGAVDSAQFVIKEEGNSTSLDEGGK